MRFDSPLFLFLLFLLPLVAWIGWPSDSLKKRRETLSLLIYIIILVCLIFSLAGFTIVQSSNDLAVVFVMDESDSVSKISQAAELAYVRSALQTMKNDDQAAVIIFGGDSQVERAMSAKKELNNLTSTVESDQTNLDEAVRQAMTLYPGAAARRMVILSDGIPTQGDALKAVQLAAENGIQIDVIPLADLSLSEAMVTGVTVDQHLQEGDHFDLKIGLNATQAMSATLRVSDSNNVIYSGQQKLEAGDRYLSLPLIAGKAGFTQFKVQLDPQKDTFYQNNTLSMFTQISGAPRVLLVTSAVAGDNTPDEAAQLNQALLAGKNNVDKVAPAALPSDLSGLSPYASVVLVDIPASSLTQKQMLTLQSYVKNLGGGLVAVGGTNSFGLGGYYQTPLEETLPLNMQIKDTQRNPVSSIVFVIDHSGSMDESSAGNTKLELAKEAVIRSLDLLAPTDRVGVLAFNDQSSWVVPLAELNQTQAIKNAIMNIPSSGDTNILKALQDMSAVLVKDDASHKHVILLTDGATDPAGIASLVKKLHDENNITLTTIGVGQDAAAYLAELAQLGGGRNYYSADPASIPGIFTKETALTSHSYIVEKTFTPKLSSTSPLLNGIDAQTLPALNGYIETSAKTNAQKVLSTDNGDPLLATWQYGLGRSIAFTSDATPHWAQQWLTWDKFSDFWNQTVRYSMLDQTTSLLNVQVQQQENDNLLIVDAQAGNGDYLNNYLIQADIIAPDSTTQTVNLQQSAPGQYHASFSASLPGVYMLHLSGTPAQGENGNPLQMTTGWVLPYSAEYRHLQTDGKTLEQISQATHGQVLSLGSEPADIFLHNLPAGQVPTQAWPWLVGLAAILLPINIATRRLMIRPQEIKENIRRWLDQVSGKRPSRGEQMFSKQMDILLAVKQKTRQGYKALHARPTGSKNSSHPLDLDHLSPPGSATETDDPISPANPPAQKSSTIASLLANKKNQEEE
jgi:uncharacterized membrane protein